MGRERYPLYKNLEKALGYSFKDLDLLETALTHRSYVNEHSRRRLQSNERLEFLGDSVLNLAISHFLMDVYPGEAEGVLSRWRASLVNEKSLAAKARQVDLGVHLLLGRGEERSQGREKDSLLADAYEALLGAIYLDGGFHQASMVIREQFRREVLERAWGPADEDFKTRLQEHTQSLMRVTPRYVLVSEKGPDHDKVFHVRVEAGPDWVGFGTGRSKKEAEQQAARELLQRLWEAHLEPSD